MHESNGEDAYLQTRDEQHAAIWGTLAGAKCEVPVAQNPSSLLLYLHVLSAVRSGISSRVELTYAS